MARLNWSVAEGDAGSGSLGIVDQHIDPSELLHGLLHHFIHHRLIVGIGIHIRRKDQNPDPVEALQLFLRILQLLHIAPCDHEIRPFLCVSRGNPVPDGSAASVAQNGPSRSRDNCCLTCQKTH